MRGLRAIVGGLCLFHIGLLAQFVRVDTSFAPTITGGGVSCITVQPDQRILIGGGFTNVNGIGRRGLARLNADGSLDESFEAHWLGPQPTISSLELYNTNIYVATYGEWLVVPCYPLP